MIADCIVYFEKEGVSNLVIFTFVKAASTIYLKIVCVRAFCPLNTSGYIPTVVLKKA
jgi:hypothetical protein